MMMKKMMETEPNEYRLILYSDSEYPVQSCSSFSTLEEVFNSLDEDEDYDEGLTRFAFAYRERNNGQKLPYESGTGFSYKNDYSSNINHIRYNNGYSYSLFHEEDEPFKVQKIKGDELKNLCGKTDNEIFTKVPEKYNNVYSDTKLGEIDKFIDLESDKLNIKIKDDGKNGDRIAYSVKLTNNENPTNNENIDSSVDYVSLGDFEINFRNYLKSKGILIGNSLDFNGWIYIEADEGVALDELPINFEGYTLKSHGGIILKSKGNIQIKGNIKSENPDDRKVLTIMTLGNDSDIIIAENVTELNVSLISKNGQVKLLGNPNVNDDNELKIYGNIIMKRIYSNDLQLESMKRGLSIVYNTNLSAPPFNTDEGKSDREKNLLMFNIKQNPIYYEKE